MGPEPGLHEASLVGGGVLGYAAQGFDLPSFALGSVWPLKQDVRVGGQVGSSSFWSEGESAKGSGIFSLTTESLAQKSQLGPNVGVQVE